MTNRRIVRLLDAPKPARAERKVRAPSKPKPARIERKVRAPSKWKAVLEAIPETPPVFVPLPTNALRTIGWRYGLRLVTRETDGGSLVWRLPDELIVDGKRIPLDRRERRKGDAA